MTKRIIKTSNAPAPIGPYNQAIQVGETLYVSGQIALNPTTKQFVNHTLEAEARQVLENLTAILSEAGMSVEDVVKCTIYLTDLGEFKNINAIYGAYFDNASPARETVEVRRLPMDARIEISCIAVKSD